MPFASSCAPSRPSTASSYDNVLSIDASHWRSLLNKAVVQVGGLERRGQQPINAPATFTSAAAFRLSP